MTTQAIVRLDQINHVQEIVVDYFTDFLFLMGAEEKGQASAQNPEPQPTALYTSYVFHQHKKGAAESLVDVQTGIRLLSFSFALVSFALLASVMSDNPSAVSSKQRFLLAVSAY